MRNVFSSTLMWAPSMMRDAAGRWSSLPSGKGLPLMMLSLPRSRASPAAIPIFSRSGGYQLWMMAERSPITLTDFAAAQKIVVERLDRGFFRSRLERLTEPEKKHLQAMACLGHGPWTEQTIAPDEAGSSRSFSVTHPFHPLNGRRFEAVDIRLCLGEERVYFVGEDGRLQRRLVRSTSLEAPDPFVEMSAGRSAFRVRDLLALSDLVASLSGSGS